MTTNINLSEAPFCGGSSKGHKGMGMEGSIARWYAKHTRKNLEQYREWARKAASQAPIGGAALEVAPGPGYLAIELARLGRRQVTGLDISKTFIDIARRNAADAGVVVDFQQGDAARMPFEAESFDVVVCTAAFKNFSDPLGALNEMCRVLRPGGKALIIDLRRDVAPQAVNALVNGMGLSWINTVITKWTFRFMLINRAYTRDEFSGFLARTKFSQCDIQENSTGFEIWLGK